MKDRIIELRKSGLLPAEIERKLGLTRGQVAGVLFRAGLKRKPRPITLAKAASRMLKQPNPLNPFNEEGHVDRESLSDPTQGAWRAHVRRRVKSHDWER